MKKSNSLLALSLSIVLLVGLTGCSRQVKLETGITNSASIKSCSYDTTIYVDASGIKDSSSDTNSVAAGVLSSGKVSFGLSGKILKTADRSKISSNIKLSSGGVSFEIPLYIDSSNTKLDFEMFLGLPDIFKTALGPDFANITNLYLSSKDLETYMKANNSADDYKKFQDSTTKLFDTKTNKNSQVSKDMLATFNSYLVKHKKDIETFQQLDKASKTKNGIYTIKISKDDIKAMAADYFGNAEYFSNFKDSAKNGQDMVSASRKDKTIKVADLDAKTAIADFNKSIDAAKTIDTVATITIEDNYVTKTNIVCKISNTSGNATITVDSKLNDINKVTSIDAPDKISDKTLDIMKLINQNIIK